jgi:hypothetical protein
MMKHALLLLPCTGEKMHDTSDIQTSVCIFNNDLLKHASNAVFSPY